MRQHKGAVIKRIKQARMLLHVSFRDLVFYMAYVSMDDWHDGIYIL